MRSSVRKIGLLIVIILVMPVLFFSVFEIGSLRQNEKVIQNIYKNQLDAILFSINQYSDDVVSSLASRIENNLNNKEPEADTELEKRLAEVPSVKGLIWFDSTYAYVSSIPGSYRDSSLLYGLKASLKSNDSTMRRLQTYIRGGYRKIEVLGNTGKDLQWIVFLTRFDHQEFFNILILDPDKFISQVLDPKIQEIAMGKFHIVAYRPGENEPFYTSDKRVRTGEITEKRTFWLLKNYRMGIELKGTTIADLARSRTRKNLVVIGLMDVILFLGAFLIYRNIARQVELSQLKSDFVSSVSHEIRTPLSLISMYIETLEMGRVKSEEKVKEYYSVILNETTRLSVMVNRILSFSQIESNKKRYNFTEVSLNDIVENASLTFRYTLENKGFIYSFEPDHALPVISADREALADAFVNLIDNAMKYSAEHKSIAVRTGRSDSNIYLEVEDQGIGISEKDQKYIFDKFFRVTEKNLAHRVKGSGLGLAIVKNIMDAHNGKIYVRSAPGSGSLFRLLFPVKMV
jgi:two-component system phosphate regulon sensor histidine kinase PhoR